MEKIVIVGGGNAAITCAETVRANNKDIGVILISSEKHLPYNRMQLSKSLSNNMSVEEIHLKPREWFMENKIGMVNGDKVLEVNTSEKYIKTTNGLKIDYSKLVLANGAYSFIPPIENVKLDGVFSIREFNDIEIIREYIDSNNIENITVIGGGVLGIEAAWSLSSSSKEYKINIIQNSDIVLGKQLDKEASNILEEKMKENNITVYKKADTKCILGDKKACGIMLNDGIKIDTDMVIISTGVRSNLSIVKGTNIENKRGIIVNEKMETTAKDVYACGDVAEYKGKVIGLWPVATDQGKIAALNALGVEAKYKQMETSNLINVLGLNILSIGKISGENLSEIKFNEGVYTKLFFEDGVIVGAILINNISKYMKIKQSIENKTDFTKEISEKKNIYELI